MPYSLCVNRLWRTQGPWFTDKLPRGSGFLSWPGVPSQYSLPGNCWQWQSPCGSALWVWRPARDRPRLWPQPDCRGGRGCWTRHQSSDGISWCTTWEGMRVWNDWHHKPMLTHGMVIDPSVHLRLPDHRISVQKIKILLPNRTIYLWKLHFHWSYLILFFIM